MQSDTIGALAAALSAAQAAMKPAEMNSVNPFFHSRYADLGAIIEAIRPVLGPNGLAFSQEPMTDGTTVSVTTTIMHASGEWRAATMTLPLELEKGLSLVQSVGKQVTYMKRYGLGGAFGVNTDWDDDGNTGATGSEKPAIARQAAPTNGNDKPPVCPKCGGAMWDNRGTPDKPKPNPKAPDWKCKDKSCDGVVWPPKDSTADRLSAAGRPTPVAVPSASNGNQEPPEDPGSGWDDMESALDAPAGKAELKAMFAEANSVYGREQLEQFREWIHTNYHVESSNDLTRRQVAEIITKLRAAQKP